MAPQKIAQRKRAMRVADAVNERRQNYRAQRKETFLKSH